MRRLVSCYAEGHGERWQAICLDFDIAIQGSSLDEVVDGLKAAIDTYVEDANKESEPHRTRLLNRRAPFAVRFGRAAKFFIQTLFDRKSDGDGALIGFPVQCPA